ncbi:fatty-acid oxidation protein subunit alpha [Hassallia byssoidea VB512170]|uniref:Fatty-acid oxidation protein subunit alpha n=1 Tax=Hassallia byssoidea VB512170 TaxID=1304833 RepID=A0A846H3U8_9CYAN|nr:XisH family protein [Hassalia byssoidea]NEU71284.1 fatty-acid oxidation protein subunit alpha [Hassalia byssoidea VB512170]
MSARDIFHNAVRVALEKDGWIITHDPLSIKVDEIDFYIDLGAERILAAQKAGQQIAVEIKSFLSASEVSDFYVALGQTLTYRSALRKKYPNRILYLAISEDIYQDFFVRPFIQEVIVEYQLKLLIFSPIKEEVLLWKE